MNKKAPETKDQSAELLQDLQRTRADFENFRKQVELQKSQAMAAARFSTVHKVLPLLDDIDRAISAHTELAPLAKTLAKTLTELELAKVPAEPGVEFNPDYHDAVLMEEGEGEKEVISETLRSGYTYQGQVLRPAMVKVKLA